MRDTNDYMRPEDFRPLTEEETRLVACYAREAGRCWKRDLLQDWENARLSGPLHALRNSHGPSWLRFYHVDPSRFELKEEN